MCCEAPGLARLFVHHLCHDNTDLTVHVCVCVVRTPAQTTVSSSTWVYGTSSASSPQNASSRLWNLPRGCRASPPSPSLTRLLCSSRPAWTFWWGSPRLSLSHLANTVLSLSLKLLDRWESTDLWCWRGVLHWILPKQWAIVYFSDVDIAKFPS